MKTNAPSLYAISIYVGIFLLIFGFQLRVVESYELTAQTTKKLARWFGPSANTVEGTVQQIVIDVAAPRHKIRPPRWLGWAMLAVGVVLIAHGGFGLQRK